MKLEQEGIYYGVCSECAMDTSKNGTELVDIVFDISMMAVNGQWVSVGESFKRHVYIYLTDAAWEMSKRKLEALQFNGNFEIPQITNEGVNLQCSHETYNNKLRDRWELLDFGERDRVPPSKVVLGKLTARYQNDAAPSIPTNTSVPATTTPQQTPPPIDSTAPKPSDAEIPADMNDDIPF